MSEVEWKVSPTPFKVDRVSLKEDVSQGYLGKLMREAAMEQIKKASEEMLSKSELIESMQNYLKHIESTGRKAERIYLNRKYWHYVDVSDVMDGHEWTLWGVPIEPADTPAHIRYYIVTTP